MTDVNTLVTKIVDGDMAGAEDLANSIIRQRVMDQIDGIKVDLLSNPWESEVPGEEDAEA